jgi:hypothetical protein
VLPAGLAAAFGLAVPVMILRDQWPPSSSRSINERLFPFLAELCHCVGYLRHITMEELSLCCTTERDRERRASGRAGLSRCVVCVCVAGAALEAALLRGTCAIDDGAFAVRGVQAAVGFEEAKYSGFPGSVVPATDPIPAGSEYVTCDLTGDFHAHPYAFNFTDVQGAYAARSLFVCAARSS